MNRPVPISLAARATRLGKRASSAKIALSAALGSAIVLGATVLLAQPSAEPRDPPEPAGRARADQGAADLADGRASELSEPPVALPDELFVDLRADLPVTLAAAVLGAGLQLTRDSLMRNRCAPSCDASSINALDRHFAGRYVPAAGTASDVLLGLNAALPVAFDVLDVAWGDRPDGALGFGEDALVLAEALSVSFALQQLTVVATGRPRPFTYGDRADLDMRTSANAYQSFYSGHTSYSFTAATTYAYLFGVHHPHSPLRGAVWVLGEGLAAMTGCLRVVAGYHFPTDVVVGAAMGTGVGLLVPWIHTRAAKPESDEASDGSIGSTRTARAKPGFGGLDVMLLPAPTDAGFGLTLLVR